MNSSTGAADADSGSFSASSVKSNTGDSGLNSSTGAADADSGSFSASSVKSNTGDSGLNSSTGAFSSGFCCSAGFSSTGLALGSGSCEGFLLGRTKLSFLFFFTLSLSHISPSSEDEDSSQTPPDWIMSGSPFPLSPDSWILSGIWYICIFGVIPNIGTFQFNA